ncbi:hypothetical protein LTR78_000649 [Recurvomyces mirabilis]|uniref:Uncharacterized protein n=1 Tax=Recurvomyces mirabilis TaxID=574656 RepID=A0AAE1C6R0_9PEZI|nr:hypothetical protein LTR78_000649 [Recurvomyces mirabilis]KAK5162303.1 hypothetical protein LTS14_000650 [Recurvomyces mirabilis]
MACKVAPPFRDCGLDESFSTGNQIDHGLEELMQFNNSSFVDGSSINPQVLSNPPSPAASSHDQRPMDIPTSPYFQSIEQSDTGAFTQASSLRHEFRRSVSEPPGGRPVPGHPHGQGQPQMVFHRDQHWLGHQTHNPHRLKSLPKGKQNYRAQPYGVHPKARGAPVHQQHQYQLRRTQTQPFPTHLVAPTSMPMPMMTPPQQAMHVSHPYPATLNHGFASHGHGPQPGISSPMPSVPEQPSIHLTSRVCTPTPEAVLTPAYQALIDPALTAPTTPLPTPAASVDTISKVTTLQMTPDELKAIITEAVQKAFATLGGGECIQPTPEDHGTAGAKSASQAVRQSVETAETESSTGDEQPATSETGEGPTGGDLTEDNTVHVSTGCALDDFAWAQPTGEDVDDLFGEPLHSLQQ